MALVLNSRFKGVLCWPLIAALARSFDVEPRTSTISLFALDLIGKKVNLLINRDHVTSPYGGMRWEMHEMLPAYHQV